MKSIALASAFHDVGAGHTGSTALLSKLNVTHKPAISRVPGPLLVTVSVPPAVGFHRGKTGSTSDGPQPTMKAPTNTYDKMRRKRDALLDLDVHG
jgi:hypothetical protein